MNKIVALTIVFLSAVCASSFAGTVQLDPKQSSLVFRINHEFGYTVGYFSDFTGTLELGSSAAEILSAKAQVATKSINTQNEARDQGLRSAMFFDSENFPQATFESTKVEGDEISGVLTIKGVAKPVTLKIQKDAPAGKVVLKGQFNRNDFGITYNKVMADKRKSIGDAVELIIELKI